MLEEYFSSGDVAEVARSLAEQVPAGHVQRANDRHARPALSTTQGACCIRNTHLV
jgi:hypothetical protein